MRIPLHGKTTPLQLLDHWMDAMACRKDDGGFRKVAKNKRRKQSRKTVRKHRVEAIAEQVFQ